MQTRNDLIRSAEGTTGNSSKSRLNPHQTLWVQVHQPNQINLRKSCNNPNYLNSPPKSIQTMRQFWAASVDSNQVKAKPVCSMQLATWSCVSFGAMYFQLALSRQSRSSIKCTSIFTAVHMEHHSLKKARLEHQLASRSAAVKIDGCSHI
jgi:hypothetical protein